jgi:1,4-dihydroxy-2-naphthoate octaprenyltransferase
MLYVLGYMLAFLSGIEPYLPKFVFGYLIFGTAQLSVSFSNEYFDRHSGRNSVKTTLSGGRKVLIEQPELESIVLKLAITLLCSSIAASAFITVFYGNTLWFFNFGLLGGLLAWFYTAPPLKLAYRGLGELSTMLAVGLLMPGIGYFVAAKTLGPLFQLFVLPLSV